MCGVRCEVEGAMREVQNSWKHCVHPVPTPCDFARLAELFPGWPGFVPGGRDSLAGWLESFPRWLESLLG